MKRSLLVGSFLSICVLLLGHSHPVPARGQNSNQATAQKIPFRIARDTTCITAPLTETGLVDYTAYLNREMSQGVTPETNAAVLYWKAIGKNEKMQADPEFFENMKQALGTDPFADGGPYLVSYDQVYKEFTGLTTSDVGNDIFEEYNASQDAPWKSAELPAVKRYLERNEKPLETVLAATQRPHYFRPLVGANGNDAMIALLLPDVQQQREITRMLKARSMLALGENRPEDAIRDLLAIHRLARHSAQGATLIEMLVGVAIESVAHDGDRHLANSEAVTSAQLAGYAKQLAELPPPADFQRSYRTERFFGLDIIQRLATQQPADENDGSGMLEVLGLQPSSETTRRLMTVLFQYGIDWNTVLIGFNEYHDRVQAALGHEEYARRTAAMSALTKDFREQFQNVSKPANLALSVFATPEQRAEQMKTVLLGLLAPALEQAHKAGTRGEAKAGLSQLGVALSAYQKQNGEFPDSLDALVPRYLPEIPKDPYTGNPFVYRVDSDGALLYSLGSNLKDDGGKPLETDHENHDHVFRVEAQPRSGDRQ
jgi:hypothetical protein